MPQKSMNTINWSSFCPQRIALPVHHYPFSSFASLVNQVSTEKIFVPIAEGLYNSLVYVCIYTHTQHIIDGCCRVLLPEERITPSSDWFLARELRLVEGYIIFHCSEQC